MSYEFYKVLHLFGAFTLMAMLGGVAVHVLNGGTRNSNAGRALLGGLHGVALLMVLVAGFGMLAKLGLMKGGMPGWVYAKLVIWLLLGGMGTLIYRSPALAKLLLVVLPVFGGLAAWLAIFKPM